MTLFKRILSRLMTIQGTAFLVVPVFLVAGCNTVFYYPSPVVYSTPDHFPGVEYEAVTFQSDDGTRLSGWLIPAQGSESVKGTIIQFHGNAENMTSHYRSLVWLVFYGYNLFTFDYRGYGQSEGNPDLHGPVQDSIAAIDYVRQSARSGSAHLILVGQSLGGALAIAAAAQGNQTNIRLVALESSFSSYRLIAQEKLRDSWIGWPLQWPIPWLFVRDTYSPENLIAEIAPIPVLLMHTTHDPVVPYHHSEILYRQAGSPKYLWPIERSGHLAAFSGQDAHYRKQFLNFLDAVLRGDLPQQSP